MDLHNALNGPGWRPGPDDAQVDDADVPIVAVRLALAVLGGQTS